MRKSNLENGMIVEWRDKTRCLVVGNLLLSEDGFEELETFNNELKDIECKDESYDVMKVFELKSIPENGLKDIFKDENLKLIWRRTREIDWSKVPKWTKVRFKDSCECYCNAYHHSYEESRLFSFGCTTRDEFTFSTDPVVEWVRGEDDYEIHPSVKIKEEWYK